jgi:dTDP-4-dehydrorhamnose reductase
VKREILLVTGGSSYLGRHLTIRAAEKYTVVATYHHHPDQIRAGQPLPLDLADRAAVLRLFERVRPQAVIHAAAINPGGDDEAMLPVNIDGSRYVAEGAAVVGARLVHVSTDVVHSGQNAPYTDDAPPTPLNRYGRSKAVAEAAVVGLCPQAAIVRTSLIYGLQEMDRGTAGFAKRLEQGESLLLFSDVIRQPVWVETLSQALLKLVELDFAGFVNVAGRQALTREEFGRKLLAYWGIDRLDLVTSGRAADMADTIPLDLRLTIAKGQTLLQMTFPGVDEVLANHPPTQPAN